MNDIYLFSNCNKLEDIKPKISSSVIGNRIYSQYHTIKYEKNKSIKIQSPLCKVFMKNKNWLNIRMTIEEKQNKLFIEHLNKLMNKLQNITQNKYTKKIIWENIKSYDGSKILNCKLEHGCLYFDNNKNLLEMDNTIVNSIVDLIFGISTIQIICPFDENDILFGRINIDILQIRKHTVCDYNLKENLFVNNDKYKEEYFKYFDMLKKGVPKKAVELKMISEGLDPMILNSSYKFKSISNIDKNVITNMNKNQLKSNILVNELRNVKLKKVSTANLKSKNKKLSMGVSLGISLEAIQKSLKSLRKTCI